MPAFDAFPVAYWVSGYALGWVLLRLAVRRPLFHSQVSNPAFGILAIVVLFVLRLPSIVFNQEISPDESQMIAQAITLRQDPVYFRSVDGTTGGPLDSYLLVLPSFFGLPSDYITARLVAFGLVATTLLLLFTTAQLWFGTEAARLALLPVVMLLGLTQNGDLLHYNSELVAVALLSGSYYLLAMQLRQPKPSVTLLVALGVLLGMVPFGKLQGVPLAAVVGSFATLDVLMRTMPTGQKMLRLTALGAGIAVFPILFVILVWSNSVYDDFVTFYMLANFQYAAGSNPIQNLLDLPRFFQKGDEFDWFVKLVLGVWVVRLLSAVARRGVQGEKRPPLSFAFLVVLTFFTLYAITRTGSEYVHYLYFLIGPLLLWLARGLADLRAQWAGRSRLAWMPAGFVAVFLLAFLVKAKINYDRKESMNRYPTEYQGGWRMHPSGVAEKVLQYARPGEKLVVWGWRCDYYVQTQMPQGVAENHTIRSVFNHPLRNAYQRRYISDIMRSFPPVFVDAVGRNNLWLIDRKTQGHESYPPLCRFIAAHYQCVGLVDDTRIYVRKNRVSGYANVLSRKKT